MPDPISWGLVWPYYLAALALGYLLGSIPFGLLITRMAGQGDIRAIGSGNIGTTNVLRTGRKSLAALTLLGDMLKGTAAVLLAAVAFFFYRRRKRSAADRKLVPLRAAVHASTAFRATAADVSHPAGAGPAEGPPAAGAL